MGKLISALVILIIVAFFSNMSLEQFGNMVGSVVGGFFTFIANVIDGIAD